MSPTGLRSSIHIAALLAAVPLPTAVAQTNLTQGTPSTDLSGEHQSDQAASVFAIQPGVGIGISVGFDAQVGSVSSSIQNSVGSEGYLRYGTSFGLFVFGGIHISKHEIDGASPAYRLTSFFLEPRFVAMKISSRWAPFVSSRLALVHEGVDQPGAELTASGYSFGGGVGAIYRLAPQVALEGSFSVGVAKLNDYVFRGEAAWYGCLEELSSGASLPESVILCDGSHGAAQVNCYPPFYDRYGGDCDLPKIPYANSGRSTTWYQVRLGIQLSFASP
jgi:hypothetical protein